MLKFVCTLCELRMKNYGDWIKHLTRESHQIEARKGMENWRSEETSYGVVVFGINSVPVRDVIKYFGDLAFVSKLIFWTERQDFCIIQFLIPEFLEAVFPNKHCIEGHRLVLRCQKDIDSLEWASICPFLALTIKSEDELEGLEVDNSDFDGEVAGDSVTPSQTVNPGQQSSSMDQNGNDFNLGGIDGSSSSLTDTTQLIGSLSLEDDCSEEGEHLGEAIPTEAEALRIDERMENCISLKDFSKTLSITKDFKKRSLSVPHPKMKEAIATNLTAVWLTLLQDFNNLVWPICFGVRLIPLSPLLQKSRTALNRPFQGVLVHSKKLSGDWISPDGIAYDFSKKRRRFLKKIIKSAKNLSTEGQSADKSRSELIFTCRGCVVLRTKMNASVRYNFTNVRGREMNGFHCQQIMKMYSRLFEAYCIQQLLTRKKIRITKRLQELTS